MGIYLERAIFRNIAPFGDLDFDFEENDVIVFPSINGQGKTTILSYIADAFFEMARTASFHDIFEDASKYYRVSSRVTALNSNAGTLVYLRFIYEGYPIDYIEITGAWTIDAYDNATMELINKIVFSAARGEDNFKSIKIAEKLAKQVFHKNILTYFPGDRLEIPAWMNHTEYRKYRFNNTVHFSNELGKNIEARIISEDIANWILDVVLDRQSDTANTSAFYIFEQLNKIIRSIMRCKLNLTGSELDRIRFGVGQRNNGQVRLAIVKDNGDQGRNIVSPSVFHLSSGEIGLLMIFAELIKQYDRYFNPNTHAFFEMKNITGIVLIDEVDKHLHIQLQKEILPELISLFPKVQFIISSHSPFFALGAGQLSILQERVKLYELPSGNEISIDSYPELDKAYDAFVLTQRHKSTIEAELKKESDKPAFFVEGKTDITILNAAWKTLYPNEELPVQFVNGFDKGNIRVMFSRGEIFKGNPARLFLGLFDFDEAYNDWNGVSKGWDDFELEEEKCLTRSHPAEKGYVMLLPVAEFRKDYASKEIGNKSEMTIEHLFEDGYLQGFYKEVPRVGGVFLKKIIDKKKSEFSEKVISFPQEAFLNFKPLFELMKRVVASRL